MKNKLLVVNVAPMVGDIHIEYIPDTRSGLQMAVNGYIELCTVAEVKEQDIEMLCDEEGLFGCKEPNVNLFPFFFVGNVVFVGAGDEGFVSLTEEQVEWLETWLAGLDAHDGMIEYDPGFTGEVD